MVKFMLDAGHGYYTSGKRSLDGSLREWSFNSVVAKYVADLLCQYENVTTYFAHDLTGVRDVPLQERTNNANALKVDAYISIHANAGVSTARGLETFIHPICPQQTVNLGSAIHNNLINTTGMINRGLKRADFHVLRESDMDAVLIEYGFMTNDEDLKLLKSDEFRHKCAEGTVNALVSFYGLKKKVTEGWVMESGKWTFYKNGVMVKNDWAQDAKKLWYFLGSDGNMLQNAWVQWKEKYYYMQNDGSMAMNKWIRWKNQWFWVDSNGIMLSGEQVINDKKYTLRGNGSLIVTDKDGVVIE
jgi:hypothetical protein